MSKRPRPDGLECAARLALATNEDYSENPLNKYADLEESLSNLKRALQEDEDAEEAEGAEAPEEAEGAEAPEEAERAAGQMRMRRRHPMTSIPLRMGKRPPCDARRPRRAQSSAKPLYLKRTWLFCSP